MSGYLGYVHGPAEMEMCARCGCLEVAPPVVQDQTVMSILLSSSCLQTVNTIGRLETILLCIANGSADWKQSSAATLALKPCYRVPRKMRKYGVLVPSCGHADGICRAAHKPRLCVT